VIVIPAIDVRGGKAVRLVRGDPNDVTIYADDPAEVAARFQEEGARRMHVIDLDAALEDGENRESIRRTCQAVAVPVQVGGGIRTLQDIEAVLEVGAARAILGTTAALDPAFVARAVEEFAERVLVAVDVRGGHVMVKGWKEAGPLLEDSMPALNDAGAPRYLVTAIARDGTLDGPDIRLYRRVLSLTERPVIASGGVRNADDIWTLREVGCEAAVTGKALYEKTLKLSQVIRGG
jgi:phosphoribosylformimino-5-aminoimidazole carboxamide ribotide isomerase